MVGKVKLARLTEAPIWHSSSTFTADPGRIDIELDEHDLHLRFAPGIGRMSGKHICIPRSRVADFEPLDEPETVKPKKAG